MTNLNKETFSIFKNISEIKNTSEKKYIKSILKDFTDCICELNNIDRAVKINDSSINESVQDFLIKLGIINDVTDINKLKTILGKDYLRFISIIRSYISLDVEIDKSLKKYMDYYRKEAVLNYLEDTNSPTLVDFFCGAGGMSLGFYQNGYKVLLANDIESVCTKT